MYTQKMTLDALYKLLHHEQPATVGLTSTHDYMHILKNLMCINDN